MSVFSDFASGLKAYEAPLDARLAFIRRTYAHVAGAVGLFIAGSYLLHVTGGGDSMLDWIIRNGRLGWFALMGGIMMLGWFARAMSSSERSIGVQYSGLGLYAAGEVLIFGPLLAYATRYSPGVLAPAAAITAVVFGGLTAYVLVTKRDFAFLRSALVAAFWGALATIIAGWIFGFNLGIWFSGIMIVVAAMAILYSTSNMLNKYRTDQYVSAALELFAAVALLFWYVLTLLMQTRRR